MHLPVRLKEIVHKVWARLGTSKPALLLTAVVILVAWVPLYRILYPPLVDLPEHLITSKLLWEKLAGVSHLDLQISWFVAYHLLAVVLLAFICFCKLFGISLLLLPRLVALGAIAFNVVIVLPLLYSRLKNRSWWGWSVATCLALPAVVSIYSACWFIGFANYVLAIMLLVPAVLLSEQFLRDRRLRDAALLFGNLVLVYSAHPFAPMFWLLWVGSRVLASFATGTIVAEWKRLLLLPAIVAPIFLYHFLATRNTSLAPSTHEVLTVSPVLPIGEWYKNRVTALVDGVLLKADDASDARTFARFILVFILVATVAAFRTGNKRARNLMLSSIFLIFVSSWISEKFIPVPGGTWLAYDYRFVSTNYAIGLTLAGLVLITCIPALTDKLSHKVGYALLAVLSVIACGGHLLDVRKAYLRNDRQARRYMARVLRHESPLGIHLPHSRWHPDGTLIKFLVCMEEPDCNPPGTTFYPGYVSELYPVKLRSRSRMLSAREQVAWRRHPPRGPLVAHWRFDETNRGDPCLDSSGNGNTGTPVGTTVGEGKLNRARSFNGRGDFVEVPPINLRDAITVSAWVYANRLSQNGSIVTKNPVNSQWALLLEAGTLKWRTVGYLRNVTCPAPAANEWHHIVAKQAGADASLYVDGTLRGSGALSPIANDPSFINIGRYDSPNYGYFLGRIDDVRLYDRALSDAEIMELYTSGMSGAGR